MLRNVIGAGLALAILWPATLAPAVALPAESPPEAQQPAEQASRSGRVDAGLARGAVLKANPMLFGPPNPLDDLDDSGGAVVVITQDAGMSDAELEALAKRIGDVASGPPPEDPEVKALADFVRPDFMLGCKVRRVPAALAGDRAAYVARCVVERAYLPDYRLDGAGILTFRAWKRGDEIVRVAHCRADGTTKIPLKEMFRY